MAKKAISNRGRGRPPIERPDYSKADPAYIAECAQKIRPLLSQRLDLDRSIATILRDYERSYFVDPLALRHSLTVELKSNPKRLDAERRKAAAILRRHQYLEVLQVIEFDAKGQGTFLSAA